MSYGDSIAKALQSLRYAKFELNFSRLPEFLKSQVFYFQIFVKII